MLKTFSLIRKADETGVSGTGKVAEGVIFSDGSVAMRWLSNTPSSVFYRSIDDVEIIHGHGGKTIIVID